MIVDCAVYQNGHRRAGQLALADAFEASHDEDAFVWVGLFEPTEEEFDSVRREFELHELAVEDAIRAHQRPKLEVYGDSLFLVLKTARYVDSEEIVELGEILVFLGERFIITVRHGEAAIHDVRLRLERRPELMRCGPSAALHAIVDRVVDGYRPSSKASTETSGKRRRRCSRRPARTRRSASTSSSGRRSSSTAQSPRSPNRSHDWQAATITSSSTSRSGPTSAMSTITCSASSRGSRASANCWRAC